MLTWQNSSETPGCQLHQVGCVAVIFLILVPFSIHDLDCFPFSTTLLAFSQFWHWRVPLSFSFMEIPTQPLMALSWFGCKNKTLNWTKEKSTKYMKYKTQGRAEYLTIFWMLSAMCFISLEFSSKGRNIRNLFSIIPSICKQNRHPY